MQLMDEAGIETTLRRVWRDREFVAEDVSDENLCVVYGWSRNAPWAVG